MPDFSERNAAASASLRRTMVDRQVRTFDVTDAEILTAMLEVPREPFLPEASAALAYSDGALLAGRDSEGRERRLLTPMILARLIQSAEIHPGGRVLDLAGGGGYGAAIEARLGAQVVAVEDLPELTARAAAAFARLGVQGAQARTASLLDPAQGDERFDAILVHGAVERSPDELLALLNDGGRLLAIWKEPGAIGLAGRATVWTRAQESFGRAPLFNASASTLPEFARKPVFAF